MGRKLDRKTCTLPRRLLCPHCLLGGLSHKEIAWLHHSVLKEPHLSTTGLFLVGAFPEESLYQREIFRMKMILDSQFSHYGGSSAPRSTTCRPSSGISLLGHSQTPHRLREFVRFHQIPNHLRQKLAENFQHACSFHQGSYPRCVAFPRDIMQEAMTTFGENPVLYSEVLLQRRRTHLLRPA